MTSQVQATARRAYPLPSVWGLAFRRTLVALWREDVTDSAAALTYYAVLALLPTVLTAVSVVELVSPGGTDPLISHITDVAPRASQQEVRQALDDLAGRRTAALTLAVSGAVSALWSVCSYLAVFRRALHRMQAVPDERPGLQQVPRIVLSGLTVLGLLVTSAVVLTVTGPLAREVSRWLGMAGVGATVWSLLKWPVLLSLVSALVLVLFRTGPPGAGVGRHRLEGGVLAALLWLSVSAGFTVYASGLGTYSKLYGSLAGLVVFLVWLWLTDLALLTGARFSAELDRLAAPDTREAD